MLDSINDRIRNEHRRLGPNERRVLDVIRHHAPISRTDVSKITGLSAATIGRIAGRLLLDDVLVETGKIISGLGRPSILLEVNATRGAVVAIELDSDKITVAVADLTGRIVWHQATEQMEAERDAYQLILSCLHDAQREASHLGMPIAALTVGVPAIVDQERGLALSGLRVQWTEFKIIEQLKQDVDVPLVVDNDVNLAAIGHQWRGDATESENFAIFSIGAGTGGAIVTGGQLVRGHRNAAGEFGYVVTDSRDVFKQPELAGGSLERIVSEAGIVNLANSLLESDPETSVLNGSSALSANQVMSAAKNGDSLANVVMDQVTRHLTVALINVTAIAAPELIIIDGILGRDFEPFLGKVRDAIGNHIPNPPEIRVSTKVAQATLFGAVAVGLEMAWSTQLPDRISASERALIG